MAGVLAVLFALGYAPPAGADDKDKDAPQGDTTEKLRELRADVTRLQKQLEDLQKARDLERELGDAERKAFRDRLQLVEDDLARLRGRLSSASRRQFSFDPSAEMGTVVLKNRLDVPATVTVGRTSYVVRARGTRTLTDVPVGAIRYTVTADGFGVGSVRRSVVSASDPLTITIYDPRLED